MRTKNFSAVGEYGFCGAVYYPDEICFAHNPNTLRISFTNTDELFNVFLDKVTVYVGTFRIDCALYGDKAEIKLSNIFKVFFNDIATKRVMRIAVAIVPTCVIENNEFDLSNVVFHEVFTVVCGGLSIGQRCNIYGAFKHDESRPYHYRRIRWFKNLPQYISMLRVAYSRTVAATSGWGKGFYWMVRHRPKVGAVSYYPSDPTSSRQPIPPYVIDPTEVQNLPSYNGASALEKALMYNSAALQAVGKGQYAAGDKIGDITGSLVIHNMEYNKFDLQDLVGYVLDHEKHDIDDQPVPWIGGTPWEPFPIFPPNDDDGDGDSGDDNDGTPNTPDGGAGDEGDSEPDPDYSGGDSDDGQTPSQSDSGYPESEETFIVVYFPLRHRFYGFDKDTNTYYETWEAQENYEDCTLYNNYDDLNNVEAYRKEYCFGGKIAIIKDNWGMYGLDFGNGESVGMIDINPAVAFEELMDFTPTDRIRLLMSWNDLLRINRTRPLYNYSPVFADSVIDIEICPRTCGYYLRWIDSIGYSQFFLFDKGGTEYEVKRSEDKRFIYVESNGLDFETRHDLYSKMERHVTCCAMFLDDYLFDEVRTVGNAAHIDLYVGKDSAGNHIWEPVTIESVTITHDDHKSLHNIEVTFNRMEEKSQRL